MKNPFFYIVLCLTLSLSLSLSSCSQKPKISSLGVPQPLENYLISINSFEFVDHIQLDALMRYQPTNEKMIYLTINVTIENQSDQAVLLFPLTYNKNKDLMLFAQSPSYPEISPLHLSGYVQGLTQLPLQPRQRVTGNVVFELPHILAQESSPLFIHAIVNHHTIQYILREDREETSPSSTHSPG